VCACVCVCVCVCVCAAVTIKGEQKGHKKISVTGKKRRSKKGTKKSV